MKDIDTGRGIIRVQVSEYQGNTYLDIRKYYEDKETGELKPTKKGISLNVNSATEVLTTALEMIKTNK